MCERWLKATFFGMAIICLGIPSLFSQPPQGGPGQEQMEKHFVQLRANMLQKTLNFDDATRGKVEQVLLESQKRQKEFFAQFQSEMMKLQEEEQQKIRAVLNPEQQARFDEFVSMQRKTMEEMKKISQQAAEPPTFPGPKGEPMQSKPEPAPAKKEKAKA